MNKNPESKTITSKKEETKKPRFFANPVVTIFPIYFCVLLLPLFWTVFFNEEMIKRDIIELEIIMSTVIEMGSVAIFVLNVLFLIQYWRTKNKTATQNFFSNIYVVVFVALTYVTFNILQAFPKLSDKITDGIVFIGLLILLPIFGYLMTNARFNLTRVPSMGVSILLALFVAGIFILVAEIPAINSYFHELNLPNMYLSEIKNDLSSKDIPGKIEFVEPSWKTENSESVIYSVTQGKTSVYGRASFQKGSEREIITNSLTNYDKDAAKLLINVLFSEDAEPVKQQFKELVNQAIKKAEVKVEDETYRDPTTVEPKVRLLDPEDNPNAKRLAEENLNSKDKNLQAFGGYLFNYSSSDFKKIVQNIDFSKLPDGLYQLYSDRHLGLTVQVKDHQVVKQNTIPKTSYASAKKDQPNALSFYPEYEEIIK